jgi:uncharacterized membrane protein YkoI
MKKAITVAIASVGLVAAVVLAQDSEKKVRQQDLPAAVQQAVKEHSQGATIKGYAMEIENGQKFYEAELVTNGHSKDITFDEQGKLIAAEEATTLDKIPAAARAAIEKGAASGKIGLVEAVTEEGKTSYEAHVTTGKKKSEIKVDANGNTVK